MQTRKRCRELGLVIGSMSPGPKNSITDVKGVRVGHCTLSFDDERGVAQTGVTAIWPADGDLVREPVPAGSFVLNGFGEITGRTAADEWGIASTPIVLTATMSVGIVYHAVQRYLCRQDSELGRLELVIPLVGECDDSFLNDSRAFHVKEEHVFAALDNATDTLVEEGCVGAGTGMQCFEFKGGIGSASRELGKADGGFMVGVLAQTNLGARPLLVIDGVPVGRALTDLMPEGKMPDYWGEGANGGSCIVIAATDAPLSNHQVAKLAKRAGLGLARIGSIGANCSGELTFAFSTANRVRAAGTLSHAIEVMNDRRTDAIYQAVIEATEEAVVNALFRAQTTVGRDGNILHALPVDRTLELLRENGRL
ncbi:MAG: P1 family peptidase [Gammaproteobacteria bacterium]|nr:P1 family peptidase [Gammaproteobacteria bacterium]